MNYEVYRKNELIGLSDNELLDILSGQWEVVDEKLEVWGELLPLGDRNFGFLEKIRLTKTGKEIYYPVEGVDRELVRIFVSPQDALRCGSKQDIRLVRAELELSPVLEREKHDNPLLLCVKRGTAELLKELPDATPIDIFSYKNSQGEINQYIYSSIYDFYYAKADRKISEEVEKKKKKMERDLLDQQEREREKLLILSKEAASVQKKKELAIEVGKKLIERHAELKKSLILLDEEKLESKRKISKLTQQYSQIEAEMNRKIERLKSYMEEKANFLKTFEFVDEEDIEAFLSKTKTTSEQVEGVDFNERLQGDYKKAVSYIQAYLVNNDILYPRHIIENFITLLRTKDLIILAGDSGSGKTNLVKSFAKAVGGKSVVIPVKPNWTSSEDLLGYYNPLEKKYLSTPFLEALLEAKQNPKVPYFICLDEMNLARVEYYFADFLSLLETRDENPEIILYSEDESSHVLSELKAVVDIIQSTKEKYNKDGVINFIELLKNETLNNQLRAAFGFGEQDSLIKYHNEIRRMLSAVMELPASIRMPENVHIIGAINIDETTHYLSPKILDRAHIMRFESPLLTNWDAIFEEVEQYDFPDTSKPLLFEVEALGYRTEYPRFDRSNPFCELFVKLNKEFFHKLGVEFGMRTIRQGLNYVVHFADVNEDMDRTVNNFLLHKVLPKFTFDGNKHIGAQTKLELIERVFIERIKQELPNHKNYEPIFSAVHALEQLVKNAKENDSIVNFWAK